MSRLKKIRSKIEDLVLKSTSVHRSRKQVLDDMSEVIEGSLREHDSMEFTGKNWGLVMKLVVLDDMLIEADNLVE
jgi:hypothetical protein